MIATAPIAIGTMPIYYPPQTYCTCSWTACCCYLQGDVSSCRGTQWIVVGNDECAQPLTKQESNKKRMDVLQRRVKKPVARIKLAAPSARPSIQALSIRIR